MAATYTGLDHVCKGLPRNCKIMTLDDFDANPHRAVTEAAGADVGTVIYTIGRNEGEKRLGCVPLAVIVPVEEYRRLAEKAPAEPQEPSR